VHTQGEPTASNDDAASGGGTDPNQALAALKWNWEATGWYRIEPPAEPGGPWGATWIRMGMSGLREHRVSAGTAEDLREALQEDFPFRMAAAGIAELDKLRDPERRPTNPAAGGQGSGPAKGSQVGGIMPSGAYGAEGSGFGNGPGPSGPVRLYSRGLPADGASL
jgi:hypothetical protein